MSFTIGAGTPEPHTAFLHSCLCRLSLRVFFPMEPRKSNDPLHGVTLEKIVTDLSAEFGWAELGRRVPVRCFLFDPSVSSSLKFLRRTPWARAKVEELYRDWMSRR